MKTWRADTDECTWVFCGLSPLQNDVNTVVSGLLQRLQVIFSPVFANRGALSPFTMLWLWLTPRKQRGKNTESISIAHTPTNKQNKRGFKSDPRASRSVLVVSLPTDHRAVRGVQSFRGFPSIKQGVWGYYWVDCQTIVRFQRHF